MLHHLLQKNLTDNKNSESAPKFELKCCIFIHVRPCLLIARRNNSIRAFQKEQKKSDTQFISTRRDVSCTQRAEPPNL